MPRYVELFPNILFRSRNPGRFRAIIIGNHQARYLAPIFELIIADCSCDYLSYHQIGTDTERAAVESYLDESRDNYRLILAQPLGREWHAISREALLSRFGSERTLFFMNLYFHGLFPDITTIGDAATPVIGPMGPNHSRIALGGWMAGLDEARILALFNAGSLARLQYPALFDEAVKDLRTRESNCDTNFAGDLINLLKIVFAFYTFNQPTPALLVRLAVHIRHILQKREIGQFSAVPLNAMMVPETMIAYGLWPVYPELRELLTPELPTGTTFILPDRGTGVEVISRETFVRRSLALYDDIGRERMTGLRQANNSHELVKKIL